MTSTWYTDDWPEPDDDSWLDYEDDEDEGPDNDDEWYGDF